MVELQELTLRLLESIHINNLQIILKKLEILIYLLTLLVEIMIF